MNSSLPPLKSHEPQGGRGWLVLLAVGVIVLPGHLLSSINDARAAFASPELVPLIERGSASYDSTWAALHTCEVHVSSLLFCLSLAMIPLLFLRHLWFPVVFSVFATMTVTVNLVEIALSFLLPGITSQYQNTILIRGTLGSAALIAWVFYLFRSRRARNTFRKGLVFSPLPPYFCIYETDVR